MNNPEIMATLCTQDTGTIKNEQSEIMATLGTQDTGAIKNEQSRDNGNIGYTRHRGNQE